MPDWPLRVEVDCPRSVEALRPDREEGLALADGCGEAAFAGDAAVAGDDPTAGDALVIGDVAGEGLFEAAAPLGGFAGEGAAFGFLASVA